VSIHDDLVARLDDTWVGHLYKNQTAPTILHEQECYPLSYDTLDFCAGGGQIRRHHVVASVDQLVLWVFYHK